MERGMLTTCLLVHSPVYSSYMVTKGGRSKDKCGETFDSPVLAQ